MNSAASTNCANCERDALITRYAHLANATARRMVRRLPVGIEQEDLISAGYLGLIKAAERFDSGRQIKFSTFAIALIRGAILEFLREDDRVPRHVRDNLKRLEQADASLHAALGRAPSNGERAREMGLGDAAFAQLLMDGRLSTLTSLDARVAACEGETEVCLRDVIASDSPLPLESAAGVLGARALRQAILRLPEREQRVITLYYAKGLTFGVIGQRLGVSESRAYQLREQALLRLSGYLQADRELFL